MKKINFFINNFYFYKNQLSVVNGSGVDLDKDLVVKKYNKLNVLTVMRPLKEKGIEVISSLLIIYMKNLILILKKLILF